jgi:hypothetical protein
VRARANRNSAADFQSASRFAGEARNAVTSSPYRSWLALWEARAALAEGKTKLLGGHARDARPLLEQAVAFQKRLLARTSPALADAEIALSNCYIDLREPEKASALLGSAKAIHRKHTILGQHHVRPLIELENRIRSL